MKTNSKEDDYLILINNLEPSNISKNRLQRPLIVYTTGSSDTVCHNLVYRHVSHVFFMEPLLHVLGIIKSKIRHL